MVLQFRPPEDLVNSYLNRPSPGQQASDSINQALQSYVALKNQQDQKALAERSRKIAEFTAIKDYLPEDQIAGAARAAGLSIPQQDKSTPQMGPSVPIDASGNVIGGPQQGPAAPGVGLGMPGEQTPVSGMGAPSLIDRWQQFSQKGTGSPDNQIPTSKAGMARFKENLEIKKLMEAKNKKMPLSAGQYAALQTGKPEDLAAVFTNPETGKVEIPPEYIGPSLSATARNVWVGMGPTGAPIRVPKGGGPAETVDVPGVSTKTNPIQSKLTPNEYKDWTSEINQFDSDSVVKSDRAILANLNQIGSEIAKYNKAMTGPLKSQQARAIAREVGALTDSDIARQSIDPSLLGRFKSWASVAATGEIPEDQLKLLQESVNTITQSASNRISSVATERATRKSSLYGGKVTTDELLQSLRLPTNFTTSSNPPAKKSFINPGEEAEYEAYKKSMSGGR